MNIAVLGLGNELLGDEGVGVHAVRRLQQMHLPPSVEVLEVGTAILDALPVLENADRVIVVDAMQDGQRPGTVYTLPLEQCSGSGCIASMHGFDIFRTMSLVNRRETPPTIVFGVEPGELSWSMELSPAVEASLPVLVAAVLKELGQRAQD